MNQETRTIWMNVTTSANWERPPVGIVRVERSLCDELGKLYGTQLKKCVWQDGRFVEWFPKKDGDLSAEQIRQDVKFPRKKTESELPLIFPMLPRKQALRAMGQSFLSLMPSQLRPCFNRFLYFIRPYIVSIVANHRVRKLLTKLLGQEQAIHLGNCDVTTKQSSESEIFTSGDVLISLGLDWDYPYYKKFYSLRVLQGVKVVTCCYDLIPVLYPQYCVNDVASLFTSYFLDVADGSDLVLCISQQSQKDLNGMLDQTGGAKPETHVFPLGDNVPLKATEEVSAAVMEICQKPFILFVSSIERRKNHEVLYRAYHLLCAQGKYEKLPRLIFVGMQGWGVNELMKDIELDPLVRGLIVQLNHISDVELRALYDAAQFCVFPSLYEGWGLPVGEALSLGKAVISSNRGSLPEVGGDVVRYIDPWSPQIWADEMYKMATDKEWRSSWETKVRSKYKPRKWIDAGLSVKKAIDLIG